MKSLIGSKVIFQLWRQYVVYNTVSSPLLYVNIGVPLGGMIGPMLYLVFMNDIIRNFSDMKFILFASYTPVVASGNCLDYLVTITNEALRKIKFWLEKNQLSFNVDQHNLSFYIASYVPILLLPPYIWKLCGKACRYDQVLRTARWLY